MKNIRIILTALALLTGLLVGVQASATASTPCVTTQRGAPIKSTVQRYRQADVWVYGDSLTYQTARNLQAVSAGHSVAVDAVWNRTTASAVSALSTDVHRYHHLPNIVVMAVGTDDLAHLSTFAQQVRQVRAVLPSRVKLIWVNIYTSTDTSWTQANSILGSVPGTNLIVRWASANLARNIAGTSPLLTDGVHVNSHGCDVRNALITDALGRV